MAGRRRGHNEGSIYRRGRDLEYPVGCSPRSLLCVLARSANTDTIGPDVYVRARKWVPGQARGRPTAPSKQRGVQGNATLCAVYRANPIAIAGLTVASAVISPGVLGVIQMPFRTVGRRFRPWPRVARSILAVALYCACPARRTLSLERSVLWRQWVTATAVAALHVGAGRIDGVRDSLQVSRVAAGAIPTEMIEFQARRDRANLQLVDVPVRQHRPRWRRANADPAIPRTSASTAPQPTPVSGYFDPLSYPMGSFRHATRSWLTIDSAYSVAATTG